jgi:hypothetical protein
MAEKKKKKAKKTAKPKTKKKGKTHEEWVKQTVGG